MAETNKAANLDIRLYERLFIDPTALYSGDKDPKLVEHIDLLTHLWPHCKVIHIYRDPRDVLASKKKAAWAEAQSDFKQLVASVAQFNMALLAQRQHPKEAVLFIKYEDLVQQPENVMHTLCEWLGVAFDANTLNHAAAAEKLVATDEMQWKSQVLLPINATNSGKWESSLSAFEIASAQYSCTEAMRVGAYSPAITGSTYVRMSAAIYSVAVKCIAFAYVQYRRAANRSLRKFHQLP